MKNKLLRICCDCGKFMGTKDSNGRGGITHSWCEKCVLKVKKDIWNHVHTAKTYGKYYHPWATEDGRYFVYESGFYMGGMIFSKHVELKSVQEVEMACNRLNMECKK